MRTIEGIHTKEAAKAEYDRLRGSDAYRNRDHAEHKAINEKVNKLAQFLYGNEPIPDD